MRATIHEPIRWNVLLDKQCWRVLPGSKADDARRIGERSQLYIDVAERTQCLDERHFLGPAGLLNERRALLPSGDETNDAAGPIRPPRSLLPAVSPVGRSKYPFRPPARDPEGHQLSRPCEGGSYRSRRGEHRSAPAASTLFQHQLIAVRHHIARGWTSDTGYSVAVELVDFSNSSRRPVRLESLHT